MPGEPDLRTIDVELDRVTNRLETLPLAKIDEHVVSLVSSAADQIVAATKDPHRPVEAVMPSVGPTALAALVSVAVRDYLHVRTAASEDAAVAEILIDLRRSLP